MDNIISFTCSGRFSTKTILLGRAGRGCRLPSDLSNLSFLGSFFSDGIFFAFLGAAAPIER